MANEILKEQLKESCNLRTSEERFKRVNNLLPHEVILGVTEDNTTVVYKLDTTHTVICGEIGVGRKCLPSTILAQLLIHQLPVYCYDDSYEIPLLLQNYQNLFVSDDSNTLIQSLTNLCRRRIKYLMSKDCVSVLDYNIQYTMEPMSPVMVYMRGDTAPEHLLRISRTVGIFFILESDSVNYYNTLRFTGDTTFLVEGKSVHFQNSDLQYLLQLNKDFKGNKCYCLEGNENISILSGKVVI